MTGLAITAAVAGAAQASPTIAADSIIAPAARTSALPTTVSVPDIAWSSDQLDADELAVTAQAPEPVLEPEPAVVEAPGGGTVNTRAATASIPTNVAGGSIVGIAYSLLGVPYVYGGSTEAGADCSGFVQMVYARAGISIPRTSYAQEAGGTIIPASEAVPGDILSWGYHVGIYIGNGMMIDSSTPGTYSSVRAIWGSPVYVRY